MALRSLRERVIQTLLHEAGGIATAAPVCGLIFVAGAAQSVGLMSCR
jgi:hypothetical protein